MLKKFRGIHKKTLRRVELEYETINEARVRNPGFVVEEL